MKDPQINYSFELEIGNPNDSEFELALYSRNFNLQNKETIYDDKKIGELLIKLLPIYADLKGQQELTLIHSFEGNPASITIKYNRNPNPYIQSQINYELEENEKLTNELIENFHKTLNEINQDVNIYESSLPPFQKNISNTQEQHFSNKKDSENEDDEPSKLEKTMVL